MATLDEVISQMSEEDYFSDPIQFIIDSDLRIVSVPDRGVVAGVVGDKNVNRINFQMPRYYNGFDMSKFKTRINYVNANGNPNYYTVTDSIVKDDVIIFSWLIDTDVVAYVGKIAFSVNMVLTDDNGVIKHAFNTSNVEKLKALEGIQVDKYISDEEQVDLISKLEADLTKYISSGINQIQDEGSKVKKSLPADYVKMTEDVTSLKEDLEFFDFRGAIPFSPQMELGSINDQDGTLFDSKNYIRTVDFITFESGDIQIFKPKQSEFNLFCYNADGEYIGHNWIGNETTQASFNVSNANLYKYMYAKVPRVNMININNFISEFSIIHLSHIFARQIEMNMRIAEVKTLNGIYVEDFGAIGDGETDDTNAIQNALVYANENNMNLVFKKKSYKITRPIGKIINDIDFNNATLVIDYEYDYSSPAFVIEPEKVYEVYQHGWARAGGISEGFNGAPDEFVCIATAEDYNLGKRKGTGVEKHWQQVMHMKKPDRSDSDLIYELLSGRLTYSGCYYTISNVHVPANNIKIKNLQIKYLAKNKTIGTVFKCTRSNVEFNNISITGELVHTTDPVENGGAIFSINGCSDITFRNVFGHNPIHCYSSGYIVDMSCNNIVFEKCNLLSIGEDSWGAIGGGFLSNVTGNDCMFSRFDAHYGNTGRFTFNNCIFELYNYTTGDANIVFNNCTLKIRRRADYTPPFCGEIAVNGGSVEYGIMLTSRISETDEISIFEKSTKCWLTKKKSTETFILNHCKLYYIRNGIHSVVGDVVTEKDGFFALTHNIILKGIIWSSGEKICDIKNGEFEINVENSTIIADKPFSGAKIARSISSNFRGFTDLNVTVDASNEIYTGCIFGGNLINPDDKKSVTNGCIFNISSAN